MPYLKTLLLTLVIWGGFVCFFLIILIYIFIIPMFFLSRQNGKIYLQTNAVKSAKLYIILTLLPLL